VHPLVLLSVTDHHARSVARGSSKRVVGVLLGQDNKRSINVANSFGVPFEEDDRDAKTWFLDHNYIESMFEMFKKVNGAFCVCVCAFCGRMGDDVFCSAGTHDWVVPYGS
jgi:hypothetical protein